jgi:Sulfocyanin (SoxE) domain
VSRASSSWPIAASFVVALAAGMAGCGSQPVATPVVVGSPSAVAKPDVSSVLRIDDPAGRVLTVNLDMGSGPSLNGFNFDGLGKGRLRIVVPISWTIHVNCRNVSSMRHSCGVVEGAQTSQLAFPAAAIPSPAVGLPPGKSASFTFVADRTGSFRITCLVPGHMEAGMWASLEISAAGAPSVNSV